MTKATNLDIQILSDDALDEAVGGLSLHSTSPGTMWKMLHESPIFAVLNRILDPRPVVLPVRLPLPPL